MGEPLKLGTPVPAPDLPINYMPAALAAIRGNDKSNHLAVPLLTDPASVRFASFGAGTIADPAALDGAIRAEFGPNDIPPIVLGPPVPALKLNENTRNQQIFFPDPLPYARIGAQPTKAVVIIDVGIAFWNERFLRPDGTSRFHDVQYLDLAKILVKWSKAGLLGFSGLALRKRLTIERLTERARKAFPAANADISAQRKAVQTLKKKFGGSFFGGDAAIDGLWHGTAVADLAAGNRLDPAGKNTEENTLLFGLELPRDALTDTGGDTMQCVLPAALAAALEMTKGAATEKTVIVLAFACPGGPHDGTHPLARMITQFLTSAATSGREVSLVLPAGNHLQDRCCARIDIGSTEPVTWTLSHDDRSPNTVEICVDGGTWESLTLTAPDGGTVAVRSQQLQPGSFCQILRGTAPTVIGGIHNHKTGGDTKLRLSLAPTAARPGEPAPAPAGDWQIFVKTASAVNLWILRDDRDESGRTPSVFSHPDYREVMADGRYSMDDKQTGNLRRSGTASVYTTANLPKPRPGLVPVTALESDDCQGGQAVPASYSGKQMNGLDFPARELVDCGEPFGGQPAVHNGTTVIMERTSGTSAAAALAARSL